MTITRISPRRAWGRSWMRWRRARRPSLGRKPTARPAAPKADRRRSRKWPSAITIIVRCGRRALGRGNDEGRAQGGGRDHHRRDRVEDPQGADRTAGRRRDRRAGGLWRGEAGRGRAEADQMTPTIGLLILAAVVAFLAFRFVKGLIKFGVLAVIAIALIWFFANG